MAFNKESGYGRTVAGKFTPVSPNGKTYIVGGSSITNIRIAQEIFKNDPDGVFRIYTTIPAAIAAILAAQTSLTAAVAVTASTSAETLTTTSAHGYNNGDKVFLSGTTAPTGTTLGLQYYVVGATTLTFQLSLQRGGSAINLTGAGTSVKVNLVTSLGDTIYVLPGHNENVTSNTSHVLNASGVKIIGLGTDEDRPTLYLDTATTTLISVTAPEVSLENFIIDGTGFDAIVTMFSVVAPGFVLKNCKIITGNSTSQATSVLTTTALANRLRVEGCYFTGSTDAGTATCLIIVGGDSHVIKGNTFMGNYTTSLGAIQNVTTACTNTLVENNVIVNRTASATVCMTFVSTSTGLIRGNHMQILTGSAPIVGAAMSWVGANYYAAVIATAGTLI